MTSTHGIVPVACYNVETIRLFECDFTALMDDRCLYCLQPTRYTLTIRPTVMCDKLVAHSIAL